MWALSALVMLAACVPVTNSGSASMPSPTAAPVTLQWGSVGSSSDAAFFIADAKGYFAEQAITLQTSQFATAALMVAPLGQNQLQVGGGTVGSGLFNAIGRGIGIRVVGDKGNLSAGHGFEGLVVRSALANEVKGPADLKGRTYALASRDITPEVTVATFLKKGGLSINDVNVVTLAFPDMQAALESGKVDAASPIEPWLTRILESGSGKLLARTDEVTPGQQNSVLLYSEQFATRRDVAVRFMVAYLKGARFYNDAFDKKDAAKRAEAIDILAAATRTDKAVLEKSVMPGIDPNGKVNVDALEAAQQYFVAKGSQEKPIDLKTTIDTSFIDAAIRVLGPYQ